MATDVIESIGSGKDYTTWDGWETANADPITADERYLGEGYDTADYNEAINIVTAAGNTDATRYRWGYAEPGSAYDPDADTGLWIHHDGTGSVDVFQSNEDYFRFGKPGGSIGVAFTGTVFQAVVTLAGDENRANSIYGLSDITSSLSRVFRANTSGYTTYFINCIAEGDYGVTNGDGAGYGFRSDAATTDMHCYNCIAIGVEHKSGGTYEDSSFKYAEGSETGDIRNCISFATHSLVSGCYEVSTSGTESHNAATDTTASGTGSLDSQTMTDFLVNPVKHGDYTLKAGSNGIGAGVDLSGIFTLDFWGNPHGAGPGGWDMGPYAQPSSGTDYVRSVSEEASAIETVAGVTASKRAQTEVASAIETDIRQKDQFRAQTEVANAIETDVKQKDQFRAEVEVAQAIEATTGKLSKPVLEIAQAIETDAQTSAYFRAVLETAQAIESQTGKLSRPVLEIAQAIETAVQLVTITYEVLETAQAIETTASVSSFSRSVLEIAQALETRAQVSAHARAVLETAAAAETTAQVSAVIREAQEVASAIETTRTSLARAVLESVQAVESTTSISEIFRALLETAQAVEIDDYVYTPGGGINYIRAVLETVNAVETSSYEHIAPPVVPYNLDIVVGDVGLIIVVESENYGIVVGDSTGDVQL